METKHNVYLLGDIQSLYKLSDKLFFALESYLNKKLNKNIKLVKQTDNWIEQNCFYVVDDNFGNGGLLLHARIEDGKIYVNNNYGSTRHTYPEDLDD